MSDTAYTIAELVDALAPDGSEAERLKLLRQLRHWTLNDLLRTTGRKHSGRGVHRRYDEHELIKAAILRELARYGTTVTQLNGFAAWIDRLSDSPLWRKAAAGTASVFLEMMWSETGDAFWSIAEGTPRATLLDPVKHPGRRIRRREDLADVYSAIVISLTKIMQRLNS